MVVKLDMSPDIPHAIWGFNGTERPGAVYLAAVLASHAWEKGIPAFGIWWQMFKKLVIQIFQKMSKKTFSWRVAALATGLMKDTSAIYQWVVFSMGIVVLL